MNVGKAVLYHPGSGKVTVQGMQYPTILLYDLSGNQIWKARQTEMDMNNQNQGLYLLRVTDDETGPSMRRKIHRAGF